MKLEKFIGTDINGETSIKNKLNKFFIENPNIKIRNIHHTVRYDKDDYSNEILVLLYYED
jgi:uncharacterized protein YhdP